MKEGRMNQEKASVEGKEENKEDDFDFDFSQYEEQEEEKEKVISIRKFVRPRITGLRSRFSMGQSDMERLAELNNLISKYSIKVSSRSQDLNILWKYYGLLDEYWESIRNIFGSIVNDEILDIKRYCKYLLNKHDEGKIPEKVHNNLLYLRSVIYRLKQFTNLGLETERVGRGSYSKAKKGITE